MAENCNKEMVDLDPLDAEDTRLLNDMITKHYAYTGSTVARFVLDDFENQLKISSKYFRKIIRKCSARKKSKQ